MLRLPQPDRKQLRKVGNTCYLHGLEEDKLFAVQSTDAAALVKLLETEELKHAGRWVCWRCA
jgi:hypothetical protein